MQHVISTISFPSSPITQAQIKLRSRMKHKRGKSDSESINASFAISWFEIMNPEHRQSNGNHRRARYRGSGPPRARGRGHRGRGRGGTHQNYRDHCAPDYSFPSTEPCPPQTPSWGRYNPPSSHHSRPNDNHRRMSTRKDHHNQKPRTQIASSSRPPDHFSFAGTPRAK